MRQRVASDLGEGSGQFDTRRSATNDHESEQFANLVRIRGALRGLESQEDAATDLRGIFNSLEPGSERLPLVVAEVVVCGSSRNHERVIFQYAVGENDLAICQVEVARLGQQHPGVLLPFQHGA